MTPALSARHRENAFGALDVGVVDHHALELHGGTPLRFGDEVRLSSLYPSYLGQVLTISGNFLTTAPGATDTWFITPLP